MLYELRFSTAAAAPRARGTAAAFCGGNLCRVLFPAQGRRGPGNKTRGMTAPAGRRLRAGGVWLVLRGRSVVRAAPTSRGWARPLPLSAAVIRGPKHGGHHACLEASASGLTLALGKRACLKMAEARRLNLSAKAAWLRRDEDAWERDLQG